MNGKGSQNGGGFHGFLVSHKRTVIIALTIIFAFMFLSSGHAQNVFGGNDSKNTAPVAAKTTPAPAPSSTKEPEQSRSDDAKPANPKPSMEQISAYDWGKLKDQRLSNAFKISKNDGVPMNSVPVMYLTDDGKMPLNPANWTITDISVDSNDGNKLIVHLHHEIQKHGSLMDAIR